MTTHAGTLHVLDGPTRGQVWHLSPGAYVLGRAADCDLTMKDPGVSRRHCRVTVAGPVVTVEDLGSGNGTLVDGVWAGRPTGLRPGATVVVGNSRLSWSPSAARPVPQAPASAPTRAPMVATTAPPTSPAATRVSTAASAGPPPSTAPKHVTSTAAPAAPPTSPAPAGVPTGGPAGPPPSPAPAEPPTPLTPTRVSSTAAPARPPTSPAATRAAPTVVPAVRTRPQMPVPAAAAPHVPVGRTPAPVVPATKAAVLEPSTVRLPLPRKKRWPLSAAPARPTPRATVFATLTILVTLGALAAVGWLANLPLLFPPLAASMALIAAGTALPLAQPRNVIGGHVASALVGFAVLAFIGPGWAAAALAGACALGAMLLLRASHSPAVGTAVIVGATAPALLQFMELLVLGGLILVVFGIVGARLDGKKYPVYWW